MSASDRLYHIPMLCRLKICFFLFRCQLFPLSSFASQTETPSSFEVFLFLHLVCKLSGRINKHTSRQSTISTFLFTHFPRLQSDLAITPFKTIRGKASNLTFVNFLIFYRLHLVDHFLVVVVVVVLFTTFAMHEWDRKGDVLETAGSKSEDKTQNNQTGDNIRVDRSSRI